jgi:signal transduction histidine kinase
MDEGKKGADSYLRTAFLERVAHELRGPAGVIHGALQELEAALAQGSGDHEVFLAMAKRGLKRILRTADRLQTTGLLERGAPELSLGRCDLCALVKQAVSDAQTVEGRRKVSVDLELPDSAAECMVDAHWMALALFELASNAIRHSQERVLVSIKAREAGGYDVCFTDDARTSFEFGPARFQPTRDGRGLGLGLSLVADVVAAHGGSLHTDYGRSNGRAFGACVSLTILPA